MAAPEGFVCTTSTQQEAGNLRGKTLAKGQARDSTGSAAPRTGVKEGETKKVRGETPDARTKRVKQ